MPLPKLYSCVFSGDPDHWENGPVVGCKFFNAPTDEKFCSECEHYTRRAEAVDNSLVWIVSTAPREPPTFERCLTSLFQAGFAGGGCSLNDCSKPYFGPFGAFMHCLSTLFYRCPHASLYIYFQDDVVVEPDTKAVLAEFLESHGAPDEPIVGSLYKPPGMDDWDDWQQVDKGWWTGGACALFFTAPALRELLCSLDVVLHRWRSQYGWRAVDQVVGFFGSRYGGLWYPPTELAHHFGTVSSAHKYSP